MDNTIRNINLHKSAYAKRVLSLSGKGILFFMCAEKKNGYCYGECAESVNMGEMHMKKNPDCFMNFLQKHTHVSTGRTKRRERYNRYKEREREREMQKSFQNARWNSLIFRD